MRYSENVCTFLKKSLNLIIFQNLFGKILKKILISYDKAPIYKISSTCKYLRVMRQTVLEISPS